MTELSGTMVQLYIYDLSFGSAPSISTMLINKKIDAIWHTSIVIFSREYYFGPYGVVVAPEPGHTSLGEPKKIENLGETFVTEDIFLEYLEGLKQGEFAVGTYNLLKHNCNNFTNEISQFLLGKTIPQYILDLPNDIVSHVIGSEYQPFVDLILRYVNAVSKETSPEYDSLNNDIENQRLRLAVLEQKRLKTQAKLERQERRKKKKSRKEKGEQYTENTNNISTVDTPSSSNGIFRVNMAENVSNGNRCLNNNAALNDIEDQEIKEKEDLKKNREPPIIYADKINVQEEFDKVIGLVDGQVSAEDMKYLEELHQYLLEDEGAWALSDGFLSFIGKLLQSKEINVELRTRLLNILAAAALKDDMILVLHQDRREHVFMNYASNFDLLTINEQIALALFVCNLFESPSSSEWLLYISEWTSASNAAISNMRVTTKIAANALLSENDDLKEYGSAIVHNLAAKEVKSVVFDDVAVELTMAILQFFNSNHTEEHVFRCMKALSKFVQVSPQDVTQLIQMIGPQPSKFKGKSERINDFISKIEVKLR